MVHYAEIALKGQNRPVFEKKLVENIRHAIGRNIKITRLYGRILIESVDASVLNNLKNVFGISHFSPCIETSLDIEEIKKGAVKIAKSVSAKTFKIDTSKSNKSFPMRTIDINTVVGDAVNVATNWGVKMKDPNVTVYVEIAEKAFVYTEKIPGPGGLPVGSAGTVLCLMSGGIDSPVAAWYAMKRGCTVIFVHFHTYTSKIENKLEKILEALSKYQHPSKMYLVPFYGVQEEIIKNVPEKMRMIVYRRMMFRIAEKIMEKEGALAFVTGDNIAQVASQTLENMSVIYADAKYPILSPLLGFDKKEIIKIAEKIGTFKESIVPYKDCCSTMIGKHPVTKAKKDVIENYEEALDIEKLVNNAVEKAEIMEKE
ncbi:tRNA 4-thiouridine(8) synthase ThiI [archaeon]|nr:tRNA 4-thiouridine(8) synthase ThiI [archaeon]